MIGKSIIAVVVMAAVMVLGFTAYGSAHSNNNTTNTTPAQNLTNDTSKNTNNTTTATTSNQNAGSGQDLISAADAQSIAKQYILQPGAQAGTPDLKEINGEKIYIVPVIIDGKNVGEIDIDAQTGKNVGGAGGA